jgi:hypothetical protein
MDPVTELGAEHVVHEAMLRESAEARKRRRRHDRVEMVAVARDLGSGTRDSGLDTLLQLLWRSRHTVSVASRRVPAILNEA